MCACLLASAGAGAALAATPHTGGGGGAQFVAKPSVAKVKCLRACASRRRARPGSTLRITGSNLASARKVVFYGSRGRADDVAAPARAGSAWRLSARVPLGAVTGPIAVQAARKVSSRKTSSIPILPAPPPEPNAELSPVPGPVAPGAPRIETGTSRTVVFAGGRRVRFSYRLAEASPSDVKVELVRASDGTTVTSWTQPPAAAGVVRSVLWNGRVPGGVAPAGRYAFRLTAAGANGATARSSQAGDVRRDAFDLYDHVFPVRGRHDYGSSGARFGAGRSGHSHQGHDVFARCGTRLVAARGGRVRYSGYHSAAGNYIVIDGAGTGLDYAYMHLVEPSPFKKGDRVYTGQLIGNVGQTGRASGCHLHFELWSAPGWYRGGRPFDPLSTLKAWDSWS